MPSRLTLLLATSRLATAFETGVDKLVNERNPIPDANDGVEQGLATIEGKDDILFGYRF
jgi:hypothetical protein